MPFRLVLPRALYDALVAHALAEQPNECCGLLAGVEADGVARVVAHYPLVNAAASPVLYEAEPRGLLQAHRDLWAKKLDVLAIYHSHPTSAPIPSKTDLARNYSEDVMSLILTLTTCPPTMRGWWLTATDYREASWEVEG